MPIKMYTRSCLAVIFRTIGKLEASLLTSMTVENNFDNNF